MESDAVMVGRCGLTATRRDRWTASRALPHPHPILNASPYNPHNIPRNIPRNIPVTYPRLAGKFGRVFVEAPTGGAEREGRFGLEIALTQSALFSLEAFVVHSVSQLNFKLVLGL